MFSKKEETIAYTLEKCMMCNKEIKRKFVEGDHVFSKTAKCASCNGDLIIQSIFGEKIPK